MQKTQIPHIPKDTEMSTANLFAIYMLPVFFPFLPKYVFALQKQTLSTHIFYNL